MRTCPEEGRTSPSTIERRVVFPQPLGPTIVTNSPFSTFSSKPSTALSSPPPGCGKITVTCCSSMCCKLNPSKKLQANNLKCVFPAGLQSKSSKGCHYFRHWSWVFRKVGSNHLLSGQGSLTSPASTAMVQKTFNPSLGRRPSENHPSRKASMPFRQYSRLSFN